MALKGGQRTVVLSDLNGEEKERFYQFLIANDVEFVLGNNGNYVAHVRVVPPVAPNPTAPPGTAPGDPLYDPTDPVGSALVGGMQAIGHSAKADISNLMSPAGVNASVSQPVGTSVSPLTVHDGKREQSQKHMSLLNKRYVTFCEMLQPTDHLPKPMSIPQLARLLEAIFDSRYQRDAARIKLEANGEIFEQASKIDRFPIFVYQYISKMLGLKRMVAQTCWRFVVSIDKLRKTVPVVAMFAFFFEEALSTKELLFYLFSRNICEIELKIGPHQRNNKRQITLNPVEVSTCLTEIFASHDDLMDRAHVLLGSSEVSLNFFLFTLTMEYYRSRTGAEGHELFAEGNGDESKDNSEDAEVEAMVKRLMDTIGPNTTVEMGQIRLWSEQLIKKKREMIKMGEHWDQMEQGDPTKLNLNVRFDKVRQQLSHVEERKKIDPSAASDSDQRELQNILKMEQTPFRAKLEDNIRTILRIRVKMECQNLIPLEHGQATEMPIWCQDEATRELVATVDTIVNCAVTQNRELWCTTLSLESTDVKSFQITCDKIQANLRRSTTPTGIDQFITETINLPEVQKYTRDMIKNIQSRYLRLKETQMQYTESAQRRALPFLER